MRRRYVVTGYTGSLSGIGDPTTVAGVRRQARRRAAVIAWCERREPVFGYVCLGVSVFAVVVGLLLIGVAVRVVLA